MTFDELNDIFLKDFGGTKLSDIARELNVTPQVVSNWKTRNQVPYKYVVMLREKIKQNVDKVQHIRHIPHFVGGCSQ